MEYLDQEVIDSVKSDSTKHPDNPDKNTFYLIIIIKMDYSKKIDEIKELKKDFFNDKFSSFFEKVANFHKYGICFEEAQIYNEGDRKFVYYSPNFHEVLYKHDYEKLTREQKNDFIKYYLDEHLSEGEEEDTIDFITN